MPIELSVPPSKSLSHRTAIAAALASGSSHIENILESEDISRTLSCLHLLGAHISRYDQIVSIQGMDLRHPAASKKSSPIDLDMGESGTTSRLITAVAASLPGYYHIYGQGRMSKRPLGQLSQALEHLGASFTWLANPGYPPCILESKGLEGGRVTVSLEQSSQFLSALLLASPLARDAITITVSQGHITSWPYVLLTLEVMERFGCSVAIAIHDRTSWRPVLWTQLRQTAPEAVRFFIHPHQYIAQDTTIEGDWSNASYFLAAGALLPQGITICGLNPDSRQGDRAMLDILTRMGTSSASEPQRVTVSPQTLNGAHFDMGNCPDLVPTVAVLASLADGATTITNVAHLRLKESDRLEALATEISKTGCQVLLRADGLTLVPQSLVRDRTIHFSTHNDHRIAMSLSLYELVGLDMQLDNPECVNKSFPNFWTLWSQLRK
jgi:3-phosphoshikimate 1-carboxyvinyltransferase